MALPYVGDRAPAQSATGHQPIENVSVDTCLDLLLSSQQPLCSRFECDDRQTVHRQPESAPAGSTIDDIRQANTGTTPVNSSPDHLLHSQPFNPPPTMFTCFEDSVLASADKDGNLSLSLAQRLLSEHGFTLTDTYADPHGVDPVALDARNAQALLHWLGY